MRIPSQIICNCYQHFQELYSLGCRKPGFSCQLHHVAFDWLESHTPFPGPIAKKDQYAFAVLMYPF